MAERKIQFSILRSIHGTFDPHNGALGAFTFGSDFALRMLPARIDSISEEQCVLKRCRLHACAAFEHVFEVNTLSNLPIGSEPQIARKITAASNALSFVSDIQFNARMTMQDYRNNEFEVRGSWKQLKLFTLQEVDGAFSVKQTVFERKSVTDDVPFFEADQLPVSLLLIAENEAVFEFTSGEDLWRNFAPEKTRFTLETHGDVLRFSRAAHWDEPCTMAQRVLRAKYHFAYLPANYRHELPPAPRPGDKCDLSTLQDVENARKTADSVPCLMATSAANSLRKTVRSFAGTGRKVNVKMQNWCPGFCTCGAHCGRHSDKVMLHWDVSEGLDFFLWANTQLERSHATWAIEVMKSSFASQLPSMIAMRFPNWIKFK